MSSILALITHWLARLVATPARSVDPDSMSLHDWADLPAHHPVCE